MKKFLVSVCLSLALVSSPMLATENTCEGYMILGRCTSTTEVVVGAVVTVAALALGAYALTPAAVVPVVSTVATIATAAVVVNRNLVRYSGGLPAELAKALKGGKIVRTALNSLILKFPSVAEFLIKFGYEQAGQAGDVVVFEQLT